MKLLVLDVEGTLFKTKIRLPGTNLDSTIWQSLALALGPEAVKEEIETHDKWKNNEYCSYLDWMKETIAIHCKYKLNRDLFKKIIASAEYNEGALEVISKIDRSKYELVMVSGGFRELTIRAQKDLNIIHSFVACEYIFDDAGALRSYNLLPCDFRGKIDFINLLIREYNIAPADWIFIGDGANDVPIAETAPVSIGINPHRELARVVTWKINSFSELPDILEMYKDKCLRD